jgi:hypothetical protein
VAKVVPSHYGKASELAATTESVSTQPRIRWLTVSQGQDAFLIGDQLPCSPVFLVLLRLPRLESF